MKKRYLLLLLLMGSLALYYPLLKAPPNPALSIDGNGHLFKIHKLMENGYKPWIKDWYNGFPFLRFYPPASYFIGAFFGKLIGSDVGGYAITLIITNVLGGYVFYELLRRLSYPYPTVGALLYVLYPWKVYVSLIEGNFPRAVAINLFPLFLWGVHTLITEDDSVYLWLSSLAVALVALTHHSALIPITMLTVFLFYDSAKSVRILSNLLKGFLIVFALTAFWFVPFFFERKYASFWSIPTRLDYFKIVSIPPEKFLSYPLIVFTILLILSIPILLKRGKRILLASFFLCFLSLGYYSPIKIIYNLPVLSIMPPIRWLDPLGILFSLFVLFILKYVSKKHLATALGLLVLCITLHAAILGWIFFDSLDEDYIDLTHWISEQKWDGWRTYFIPNLAWFSYSPILSGRPTLNGWYHEGTPSDPAYSKLTYLIAHNNTLATQYLSEFDIKFIVLAGAFRNMDNYFKKIGFKKATSFGEYEVLSWNRSKFFQPIRVLFVGRDWDLNITHVYLTKLPKTLEGLDVVLYSGVPRKEDVELLRSFAEKGGTVVLCPDSSFDELFGVKSKIAVISRELLSSTQYDISRFSNFEYSGGEWYAPVFWGNLTPLITYKNYTALGVLKIGKGRVYFVGLNLLYHSFYTQNEYEKNLIEGLILNYTESIPLKYKIIKYEDGFIEAFLNPSTKTFVILAESYYPYWTVEINGENVKPLRDLRTGLMVIPLRDGENKIIFSFKDPFSKLRDYSFLAWLSVSLLALIERREKKIPIKIRAP